MRTYQVKLLTGSSLFNQMGNFQSWESISVNLEPIIFMLVNGYSTFGISRVHYVYTSLHVQGANSPQDVQACNVTQPPGDNVFAFEAIFCWPKNKNYTIL